MAYENHLAAVRRAYAAWDEQRFTDLLAELSDDIVWSMPGHNRLTSKTPGKPNAEQVLKALTAIGYQVSPRHFLADGQRVVALAQVTIGGVQHGAVDIWTFDAAGERIAKYGHASTDTTLLDHALGAP
jgi:ketosteroid isomerase-like protein